MRIRRFILAIPIGLLPVLAMAQTPPAAPAAAPASAGAPQAPEPEKDDKTLPLTYGSVDFGVRGSHIVGDGARYERYRDLSDGLFIETARVNTMHSGWFYDLAADHVGRKDQRYEGTAIRPGVVKAWGLWDQIPMLMSRTTQTLFTETAPGVLEIDDAIQLAVQANPANLTKFIPTARTFELSSHRHIFDTGAEFYLPKSVIVDTHVRNQTRGGDIPFGGSFGHSNVVETIAPVEHHLTDFDTTAEYAQGALLLRGGYTGSWFHNDVTSLTFDNPWRLVDTTSAGSRGRIALAPSNSFIGVNGLVSYRLPHKSRVNLYATVNSLNDTGDSLLPFTVNTALPMTPLDRATTQGHADTSSINASFVSRPTSSVDIDVRFRTYDYDNKTPLFTVTKRVAYDNAISTVTPPKVSEPFGVKRETLDADVRFSPDRLLTTGLGYSHQGEDRTYRIFDSVKDDTFRLVADSIDGKWLTLRTKYQYIQRRGEGDPAEITDELTAIGEQPGMRHFDIASRNRNQVTMTGLVMPINNVSFSGSFAAGKDNYLDTIFGMFDNTHQIYSAGMEYAPSDYLGAGLSYSYEQYGSVSQSRQANPPPDPQFYDVSRNWSTNTDDNAHSVIGHAEIRKIKQHLDVIFFGDYNRTNGIINYVTGPVADRTYPEEAVVPSTLPPPTQLAPNHSELLRGNLDLLWELNDRWTIGGSIWYERYRVKDFTLDAEAQSRLDPQGALLLGYTYAPYTAQTYWLRAMYKF